VFDGGRVGGLLLACLSPDQPDGRCRLLFVGSWEGRDSLATTAS
jgi:hypothetical protein